MGSKISGVAIVLKDFLLALDNHGISHASENQIRQHIRKRSDCQTHMKPHFLKKGYKSNRICRLVPSSTWCKTCICIPWTDIPDTFFESLCDNSEIHLYWLTIIYYYTHQHLGSPVDTADEKLGSDGIPYFNLIKVMHVTVFKFYSN